MLKKSTTGDNQLNNFLIQNFFIIGLGTDLTFDESFYNNIKTINQFEKLSPKILSKFPIYDYPNQISNNIIIRHCFPNGFYIKNAIDKPQIEQFYFALDNLTNEFYPKIYFTCLLFYECVEKYYDLKENYNSFTDNNEYSSKQIITINEKSPFMVASNSNNSLNSLNLNHSNSEYERYYIPKIICFSSFLFFPKEFMKILLILYKNYTLENKPITEPIEKLIENIFFKLPLVPRGRFSFTISLFHNDITFRKLPINQLPYNSIELNSLFEFKNFKINNILTIFKYVLLEVPILIFSENKYKLTTCFFSLQDLIYPFKYCNCNISILPVNCYNFIGNYDSFMFGINKSYYLNFFHDYDLEIDKEIVIFDIDRELIEIKHHDNYFTSVDLSKKEINNDISKIDLPLHYKKKLLENLGKYLKNISENKIQNEYKNKFNLRIKEYFFYFLMSILLNYQKHVKYNNNKSLNIINLYLQNKLFIDIESIFNVNDYLLELASNDHNFYKLFFKTNMFKNFIIKKIYPKNLEDKIEILYFDERIIEKRNKSVFGNNIDTPFIKKNLLKEQNFLIKFENYYSTNETVELSESKKMKNALLYYQKIYNLPNEDKINIEYPIFPKLLNDDIFFGEEYQEKMFERVLPFPGDYIALNKNEIYKILNSPKYTEIYYNTGYRFDLFKPSVIQMETYVNYSWLILMGLSFTYINNKYEKNIRFNQIIDKLELLKHKNDEILIFLLYIILEEGSEENILSYINIIFKNENLKNKYLISSILAEKFTSVFNLVKAKRTYSLNLRNVLIKENEERDSILNDSSELKRSLYKTNGNETISFSTEVKCSSCNELNEVNFSLIFEKNISKGLKYICKKCQTEIIPQIKVQINEDKLEWFDLLTPLELYESLRNNFIVNKLYFDVPNFHSKHKNLFWNSILYFYMKKLSFDFIIPYENDIVKIKSLIYNSIIEDVIIDDFEIQKGPEENFIENKKENNIVNPFSKVHRNNSFTSKTFSSNKEGNFERIEEREIDLLNGKLTLNNK